MTPSPIGARRQKPPATLTALCKSPDPQSPENLEHARRILATPRGLQSIRGIGRLKNQNGDPLAPPRAVRLAAERDLPELLSLFAQAGAWIASTRRGFYGEPLHAPHPLIENGKVLSPLSIAAQAGAYSAAKRLLSLGADPNWRDESDATPLHRGARAGRSELFGLLVAHGADPNEQGHNGLTPLLHALISALRGDFGIEPVDTLLALGADIHHMAEGFGPLHYAATDEPDSVYWIKELIARGANPNASGGPFGSPLLSAFLETGDISGPVRALLDAGADPLATDAEGYGIGEGEYDNRSGLAALRSWREAQELDASLGASPKARARASL